MKMVDVALFVDRFSLYSAILRSRADSPLYIALFSALDDDDDEVMLNVLGCRLTY